MKKINIFEKVGVPVLSVLVALVVGSLILIISGLSPAILFKDIVESTAGDANRWLMIGSMLTLTGLSIGFSYRGGLFNIGAEGQFIVASLIATVFATTSNLPDPIVPIIGVILGFIAGAIWAFLPGLLKALYGISEVVITIMMNWIAMYLFDFIILTYFHQETVDQSSPLLSPDRMLQVNIGTDAYNYAIIIALIMTISYWFILEKTTFGFEVKAIGSSSSIAEYTGISAKSRIIQTMMISGGLAGMAGAFYGLSYNSLSTIGGSFTNYGFDGIAVALLGSLNAFGTLVSGLLLAALRNADAALSYDRVPSEISDIIIGLIILFSVIGPIIYKKYQKRGA